MSAETDEGPADTSEFETEAEFAGVSGTGACGGPVGDRLAEAAALESDDSLTNGDEGILKTGTGGRLTGDELTEVV